MAFSLGGTSNGNGRGRFRGVSTLSEINVVPLVDVVLVLLIIFMLTAHVMEYGLEINVPQVNRTQSAIKELPVISLTREADIYLDGKPVNFNSIVDVVRQKYPGATAVYLQADKETPFDPIAQVMAEFGEAKFQVNVVTEPVETPVKK